MGLPIYTLLWRHLCIRIWCGNHVLSSCIGFCFGVDMLSCRFGRPAVEMGRSLDRLVSPMGLSIYTLLGRHLCIESIPLMISLLAVSNSNHRAVHLYIESVPGIFMLNSVNAVGVHMVLVRCRCALLLVLETRCGGETVLMTVLSPQWDPNCCCVGIVILNRPLV